MFISNTVNLAENLNVYVGFSKSGEESTCFCLNIYIWWRICMLMSDSLNNRLLLSNSCEIYLSIIRLYINVKVLQILLFFCIGKNKSHANLCNDTYL